MTVKVPMNKANSVAEEAKQPVDTACAEAGSTEDATLEELLDDGVQTLLQLNRAVHEELRDKPERLAEWDALMHEYADVLAEGERKAEEKKLDQEIREWMNRIGADVDRLTKLDPADLEADETLARTFASLREVDAVMRLRCRHYPDKLARWEDDVMGPVKIMEAVFTSAMEEEEAKPGN
jgi:hypothetical protein